MNYRQAMAWERKHPRGTRQPLNFSTGSGFWPSGAFLEDDYFPYLERCKQSNTQPMSCEDYYNLGLKRIWNI